MATWYSILGCKSCPWMLYSENSHCWLERYRYVKSTMWQMHYIG